MALGAEPRHIVRLMVSEGMQPAAIGLALGLVAAYGLTRFLEGLLFQVSVTDPRVFVGLPTVLLAVALAACWLPARRGTRIEPTRALRED